MACQSALIAASAVAALSAIAVLKLPLACSTNSHAQSLPSRSGCDALSGGAGALEPRYRRLNPFFNVYFATQLKAPLSAIGVIFSSSHTRAGDRGL